jgi:GT2 family glycosyltransferase/radical SAM superfamily enzyme YgiQ (UPF0313 family)
MPFPFFLAYASAVLEESGHDVMLVDGIAEGISEDEFVERITSFGPHLILLEVSTISIQADLSLARRLRDLVGEEVSIAFCGLDAHLRESEFLKQTPFVDYALIGEYEYTLRDLAEHLEKGKGLQGVAGLSCRDGDGQVRVNNRRPLISNLNDLPWPARHQLPMENYHDEPGNIPRPSVQILASRGCPFGCVFCAWPQIIYGSRKYRIRNPVDVADEFEWLVRVWGFKSVYFDDDTFNIGGRRVLRICRELRNRRLNTPWAAMCRADTMTPHMLEEMVESGLHAVKYGVETADQDILNACGKRLDIQKVKEVVRLTHQLGVHTHLTFMFGLPGETRESAQQTIDLALELNPESVQFTIATPFPGSTFYHQLMEQGMITCHDYAEYDGFRSAVIRTEALSSQELEEVVHRANRLWEENRRKRGRSAPACQEGDLASVIIPNFNGRRFLQPCLDSLMVQTKKDMEVILVDNGSTDDSVAFTKQRYPEVRVLQLPSNRGFAGAVNQGIEQARGQFIAVLNNDTVAEARWLEMACDYLATHPEAGSCASKVLNREDPPVFDSAGSGLKRSGYTFNLGNGKKDSGQYDVRREVFGASASAAVYRKRMLEEIGPFDDAFFMYLEDVDLSFRSQLWGYRCVYLPEAVVHHVGAGTSGSQYHRKNVYFMARNSVYVLIKNMPREILKSNIFRILGFFAYLQLYHTLRTVHPWSCAKGICRGLLNAKDMISKRRRILGGKRVEDDYVETLLRTCEREYKAFKRAS